MSKVVAVKKFFLASGLGALAILSTSMAFLVSADIKQSIIKTDGDHVVSIDMSAAFESGYPLLYLLVLSICAYGSSMLFRALDKSLISDIEIHE